MPIVLNLFISNFTPVLNTHMTHPVDQALGYTFRNEHLRDMALTHRSFRFENTNVRHDNQRLEFLGDAALGLVSASYLYANFPDEEEGWLTATRAMIANSRALSRLGKKIDLGSHLKLGKGEKASGGHDRDSNLTDAIEALLGAAYLDGGYVAVKQIFDHLFVEELNRLIQQPMIYNPKGALQELIQKELKLSPSYEVVKTSGPAHAREFKVCVSLQSKTLGYGHGHSKQAAENEAAQSALELLSETGLSGFQENESVVE